MQEYEANFFFKYRTNNISDIVCLPLDLIF